MTTPIREQVVQWINRSGIAETNYVDMYVAHISNLEALVVMVRADLEATIAEQAAEIARLRQFRSDVAHLSLYLCGGHYEPRNNDEADLAGRIIKALDASGSDILQPSSWMAHRSPIAVGINKSGPIQMRQDQVDAYPDEP